MRGSTIETERLVLRPWRDADRAPFAALNADPQVMEHFPGTMPRAQSDAFVDRHAVLIEDRGWGLWAVEVKDGPAFIGFTGLAEPVLDTDFVPCVEVGWRLAADHWGNGYAPEAATAALAYGFDELDLAEIVSFTWVGNRNSRRVMEKIGLDQRFEFDHPNLPGHRLERHILYSTTAKDR